MKNKNLYMLLAGCGMVTLLFAGCGGGGSGGGGGTPNDTTISSAPEAQQAAVATVTVFSGGLSNLVPSTGAPKLNRTKALVANFKAKNLPQESAGTKALALFRAKRQAAGLFRAPVTEDCPGGGTVTNNSTFDPTTGSSTDETIYNQCNDGAGGVINGREKYSETYNAAGTYYQEVWIAGDGDGTAEASDLVYSYVDSTDKETFSGTETYTQNFTSGTVNDYWNSGTVAYNESDVVLQKLVMSSQGINITFSADLTSSGTGSQTGNGSTYTETATSTLDGGMSVIAAASGQQFKFAFTATDVSDTWTYNSATLTSTDAPNGTITISMLPSACFDGTFTVDTITPITSVYNPATYTEETTAGEMTINTDTRMVFSSPDIITITLKGTEVYQGTQDDLVASLAESCPMYGMF